MGKDCNNCKYETKSWIKCPECKTSTKKDSVPSQWQPKETKQADNINHPGHYCTGNIEVINYIEDKLTPEQ